MKQLVMIAAVLAFAACGSKKEGGGGGGEAACAAAIGKAVKALPAGGAPGAGEVQTRLQAALTKRCTEDKWPADVIACYEGVTSMQAMTACRQKLPPDLAQKTIDDIRGAMMGGMGGMGGPGGPGMGGMRGPHGGGGSGAGGGVQIPDGVKVPVSDTAGTGSAAAAGGSPDAAAGGTAGSAGGSAAPAK